MSLKKVVLFGNPLLLDNFVGLKLPFPVVKSIANRIGGPLGLLEVLSSNNGFFIFSFDSVVHASAILDMANRHLVLQRWSPNMQFSKVELYRIPVW
jgi:hypothetical protein